MNKPHLCDRCGYDEAVEELTVPDMFQDRYLDICDHCATELNNLQSRTDYATQPD